MSEALKNWLSKELDTRRWSQGELARRANISRPLVSRTLSGDVPPSADFCIKVSKALEISPEYLLRLAEIIPPSQSLEDVTIEEINELLKNLSLEQRQEILNYVKFLYHQRHG